MDFQIYPYEKSSTPWRGLLKQNSVKCSIIAAMPPECSTIPWMNWLKVQNRGRTTIVSARIRCGKTVCIILIWRYTLPTITYQTAAIFLTRWWTKTSRPTSTR